MENNENEKITIPIYALERMQAKDEAKYKLLCRWAFGVIFALITIIVFLIVDISIQNKRWIDAWNSYDYVDEYSIEAEQDGEGINIVGGGDVAYGTEGNSTTQEIQNP